MCLLRHYFLCKYALCFCIEEILSSHPVHNLCFLNMQNRVNPKVLSLLNGERINAIVQVVYILSWIYVDSTFMHSAIIPRFPCLCALIVCCTCAVFLPLHTIFVCLIGHSLSNRSLTFFKTAYKCWHVSRCSHRCKWWVHAIYEWQDILKCVFYCRHGSKIQTEIVGCVIYKNRYRCHCVIIICSSVCKFTVEQNLNISVVSMHAT